MSRPGSLTTSMALLLFVFGCGQTSCASQSGADQTETEAAPPPEKPSMPNREDPTSHTSDCSERRLASIDRVTSRTASPGRLPQLHASLLSNSCAEALPDALQSWLEPIGQGNSPPSLANLDGITPVFTEACPAGPSILADTESLGWNERLGTIYDRCGLSALEFASREEFQMATGPEAATAAVVLFRWLVADGARFELAETITRGLAGIGSDEFYGVPGDLLHARPDLRLARTTGTLEPSGGSVLIVGPNGLWEGGERVVDFGDSRPTDPSDELTAQLEEMAKSGGRRPPTLQLGIDASVDSLTVSRLLYTASQTGFSRFKLLAGTGDTLSSSGTSVAPTEWKPQLKALPISPPRATPGPPGGGEGAMGILFGKSGGSEAGAEGQDLELTVNITPNGHRVVDSGRPLPAREDCPASTTVCLTDDSAEQPVARYDWSGLYETVAALHAEHPNERDVEVSVGRDVPFGVVVRTLDVLRHERQTDDGTSLSELDELTAQALKNSSPTRCRGDRPCRMFSRPIWTVSL